MRRHKRPCEPTPIAQADPPYYHCKTQPSGSEVLWFVWYYVPDCTGLVYTEDIGMGVSPTESHAETAIVEAMEAHSRVQDERARARTWDVPT